MIEVTFVEVDLCTKIEIAKQMFGEGTAIIELQEIIFAYVVSV